MLKQRIITAIVLIPIFIFLLFTLPLRSFTLLTGVLTFWCAMEWSVLMGVKTFWRRLIFPMVVAATLLSTFYFPISFYAVYIALIWWIAAFFLIWCYPKHIAIGSKNIIVQSIIGLLVLVPCWLALNYIRYAGNGAYILLFLFVIIWGADSGAYFVGRYWGRHKMAPLVSPGKTWEGLFGALIVTAILCLVVIFWYHMPYVSYLAALALMIITVLFSVVGDLFESMLKRNAGLKDSGTSLPGHGGILDRVDSLTAAAPVFFIGLTWMGKLYYIVN